MDQTKIWNRNRAGGGNTRLAAWPDPGSDPDGEKREPFYRTLYEEISVPDTWEEFRRLPFTDASAVREQGLQMLCVPQGEIERVVTLTTTGTSGRPKRLYFTGEDQELTIDFFTTAWNL